MTPAKKTCLREGMRGKVVEITDPGPIYVSNSFTGERSQNPGYVHVILEDGIHVYRDRRETGFQQARVGQEGYLHWIITSSMAITTFIWDK